MILWPLSTNSIASVGNDSNTAEHTFDYMYLGYSESVFSPWRGGLVVLLGAG